MSEKWKENGPILIEVWYHDENDLGIVSACGNFGNLSELHRIEKDLIDNPAQEFMGAGAYTFRASWCPGEYGEYGRCEVESGWELEFISADLVPEEDETTP